MNIIKLDLRSEEWSSTSAGAWQGRADRKGVYVMSHPYEPAQEGGFCHLERTVVLPAGVPAGGAVWLRFYSSDSYVGSDQANPEIGYEAENHPGCRFRQVLINDQVVWEADVAGLNPPPPERFYSCEITPWTAGPEIRVAFRVVDLQPPPSPFATEVFWGCPELIVGAAGEQPEPWSAPAGPRIREESRPQPPPPPPLLLQVSNPLELARFRAPVTSGLPFPPGHLTAASSVRLLDGRGQAVPLQTEVLGRWPDGSVRWLLLDFQADVPAEGTAVYRLEYGDEGMAGEEGEDLESRTEDQGASFTPITVVEADGRITVETGRLQAVLSSATGTILEHLRRVEEGVEVVFSEERLGIGSLLSLENYEGFPSLRRGSRPPHTLIVETAGPLRTVILAAGEYVPLRPEEGGLSYVLRFHFYAGKPTVKIEHTLLNTALAPVTSLRTISLHLPPPGADGDALVYTLGSEALPLRGDLAHLHEARLIQSTATTYRLFEVLADGGGRASDVHLKAQRERAAGWADLSTAQAGLMVAVRDFWQQFPKAFRCSRRGIQVDLWTSERIPFLLGTDPPFRCRQGQAKTHELLLYLHPGSPEEAPVEEVATAFQAVLSAQAPPEWNCASQAWGPIAPADPARFPRYEAAVAALDVGRMGHGGGPWWEKIVTDGGEDAETYDRYGMEHWGDHPLIWGYQTQYRMWANCEYDLAHAAFVEYARSGDRRFFWRGVQAALHLRDVDLIHFSSTAPETVGGPHGHGIGHCDQPPNAGHVWSEGLVEHYWLTGDRRSLEVARELGDFLLRLVEQGRHRGTERDAGWPLIALLGIYHATLEEKYLRAAQRIVEEVIQRQDPLRGVWSTPIYEQPAYEGGTTFMVTILARALMRYYEATGDQRAAQAIVRAADWILDEALQSPPGQPPQAFYKQAPRCAQTGPLEAEAVAYAYALTGDEAYGSVARAAFQANLQRWTQGVPTAAMRDAPRVLAILEREAER
jgi:hypothetical protein